MCSQTVNFQFYYLLYNFYVVIHNEDNPVKDFGWKMWLPPRKKNCGKLHLQFYHDRGLNIPDQRSTEAYLIILCLSCCCCRPNKKLHQKKQGYPVSPTSSTGSPNSRALPTKMASLLIPWVQTMWLKSLPITDICVENLAAQHKAICQLQSHLENYWYFFFSRKLTQ